MVSGNCVITFGVEVPMINNMKIAVIGTGRMGQRHIQGALQVASVEKIYAVDINAASLENAKMVLNATAGNEKINYLLTDEFYKMSPKVDVIIMASTAGDRKSDVKKLLTLDPKVLLLEKPLGQSLEEVNDLIDLLSASKAKAFVNLNTRLYESFNKLKNDINTLPQFKGFTDVSVSTGTIGVGANGIHYIDLMSYLFDADEIEFVAGEISEKIIPSGRGPKFCDFGGWCILNYKKNKEIKARVHFALSSESTSLGTMNFTFPNARVIIDEFEQTRYNKYRKADSQMPVQRYAADYQAQETEVFTSPDLKLLTQQWLESLSGNENLLPDAKHSLLSHKAMFEWLSKSKTHQKVYPVT